MNLTKPNIALLLISVLNYGALVFYFMNPLA